MVENDTQATTEITESDSTGAPEGGDGRAVKKTRNDPAGRRRNRLIRLGVLALGLVTITGIGIAHQYGALKPVGVDALCPFGGVETFWSLITAGGYVQRIAASSVVLLGIVLVTALLFRRAFCGYICPLGALQELIGKVRRLFTRKPRLEMPAVIDRPARYLKYVVLVVFTVWTWQAASLVIRPYDPWVAWMHLSTAEVFAEFSIGLAVLVVSLIGSVVYDRFFCKYLCPMGAFLGLISRVSLFRVQRTEASCIDCKACDGACPTNIAVSQAEVVNSPECINCNECVNACPVAGTLEVAAAPAVRKRWSVRPAEMLVMVAAIIVVGLVASSMSGSFVWTLSAPAVATAASGPMLKPEDIKGSMTFQDVAKATGIAPAAFEARFGVKPEEMTKPIKDLASSHGFDVHTDVRDWVAKQLETNAAKPTGSAPATGTGD